MTKNQVIKSALSLAPDEKIKLIDLLISDLDADSPIIEREWKLEIKRRVKSIDAGRTRLIPFSKVMLKLRK